MERHVVQVVVTDDLVTYKPVLEELRVAHQVCVAYDRKNATRRLKEVEGWAREKEKAKALMKKLPPGGGKELLELEKEVRRQPNCGNWCLTWVRSGAA
jgi:hypothetical protein